MSDKKNLKKKHFRKTHANVLLFAWDREDEEEEEAEPGETQTSMGNMQNKHKKVCTKLKTGCSCLTHHGAGYSCPNLEEEMEERNIWDVSEKQQQECGRNATD